MLKRLTSSTRPLLHRLSTALVVGASASSGHAHDGHGLFGPHWHATDVFGYLALALAVAAALWFSRGGK